jgi:transcription initiation factor TFIIB
MAASSRGAGAPGAIGAFDYRDRSSHVHVCRDCKSTDILEDHHSGDIVCKACGLVQQGCMVDQGQEWRQFADDDGPDRNRTGGPGHHLLSSTTAGTVMARAKPGEDRLANSVGHITNNELSSDRHLRDAFRQIRTMAERIAIPMLAQSRAEEHYRDLYVAKQLRGRRKEGVLAAVIYIACKQEKMPRTFKEIGAMTACPDKEIHKCYKLAMKALGINAALGSGVAGGVSTTSAADFVSRYCSQLQLPIGVDNAATHVARAVAKLPPGVMAGKSPISLAMASIYLVTRLDQAPSHRSFTQLAQMAGITEATIRKAYHDLHPHRVEVVPGPEIQGMSWEPVVPVETLPL